MRLLLNALAYLLLSPLLPAQQAEPSPNPDSPALLSVLADDQTVAVLQPLPSSVPMSASPSPTSSGPKEVVIPRDTLVRLQLMEGLSTVTDHEGYVVHMEVASDLVVDGVVVLPAGTPTTVKLTHAGSQIEFSDPKLVVDGRRLRLSRRNSRDRGASGGDIGAAIVFVIVTSPVLAIQLPISAVYGAVHAARTAHHPEPKRYVWMEKGESFDYYTRDRVLLKVSGD